MLYKETLLRPFFDAIMPDTASHTSVAEDDAETIFRRTEKERAKLQYWSDEDEERERKREVIVGLWCKVMVSLISKRTTEVCLSLF
jgi:SIT4-associating protein SAP185/190